MKKSKINLDNITNITDINVKDIANQFGLSAKEFYIFMNSASEKINYMKKNNPKDYELRLLGGVCKANDISINELIKMIALYKIQKKKI